MWLGLTFRVLEVWVTVDAGVADIPVPRVEDIGQLAGLEWAWDSPNEDGLASINGLGVVHDVIAVTESPGPDLHLCWWF